jgi:nicotinate-nucleotide adenylyltransferase
VELIRRASVIPANLGILPGTFNPPTKAHIALAEAALGEVDEVMFVLPRAFPHKSYDGVPFEQRLRMLQESVASHPSFSIAASGGGLFIEIARECRSVYGPGPELAILCGRDAAERIAGWDYGQAGAFEEMLREFRLLVAPRQGCYVPPAGWGERIRGLAMAQDFDELSATEVRRRIAAGAPWRHLVPERIAELVEELYRPESLWRGG